MQRTHFWNKFDLHWKKVIILSLLVISTLYCSGQPANYAQSKRWIEKNNPNYDLKKLTYGFLIGLHSTIYQLKYSDRFVDPNMDSLHSINAAWKVGFSLGFIVNYRLNDQVDLRLTPTVAFYEHEVQYVYSDDTPLDTRLIETTMVELPLLLKYKSERRGNIRMYMIGGIKPSIEASGQKNLENSSTLEVKGANLHLEAGFGFDLYYPLFKFSPEIRFSRGLINMLDNTTNAYGIPLQRMNTNTISVYFLFQ